jgi:DNA-3-methyladenine glycosylase II/AraC family transcriptional regulator of adaptative response / DNA-3-methyladenine glycosylase II
MRALREPDAFPAADIGLLRALATSKGRPTPAELLARADAWRPWRAYAALHLWTADAAVPATSKETRREPIARSHPLSDRGGSARL